MFVIHKYPGIPRTSISTVSLHDRNLTPTAVYLHLWMMPSCHEEENLSIDSISYKTGLGVDRVSCALRCLENAHYIIRKRMRVRGRLDGTNYRVFEVPYDFYAKTASIEKGGNDYANHSC